MLRPLFRSSNLRALDITVKSKFTLLDDDLRMIASAWTQLEKLVLSWLISQRMDILLHLWMNQHPYPHLHYQQVFPKLFQPCPRLYPHYLLLPYSQSSAVCAQTCVAQLEPPFTVSFYF